MVEKRLVQSSPLRVKTFFLSAVDVDLDAVAVELDLMKPLLALRSFGLQRRKLGLNEPRHVGIRFGNNATHKKARRLGARRAFYSLPSNLEQSGDVILPATTSAIGLVRK